MKLLDCLSLGFMLLLSSISSVNAALISITPSLTTANIGNSLIVDVTVSELGDGAAPSLSVFDLDISYDASIINFNSASFGNQLDLFGLGSLQQVDSSIPGTINLFELSFDFSDDLDNFQAPAFLLASLTFDALAIGSTGVSILSNSFGDSRGNEIIPTIVGSSIEVKAVPLPVSFWLMLTGIIFMHKIHKSCNI